MSGSENNPAVKNVYTRDAEQNFDKISFHKNWLIVDFLIPENDKFKTRMVLDLSQEASCMFIAHVDNCLVSQASDLEHGYHGLRECILAYAFKLDSSLALTALLSPPSALEVELPSNNLWGLRLVVGQPGGRQFGGTKLNIVVQGGYDSASDYTIIFRQIFQTALGHIIVTFLCAVSVTKLMRQLGEKTT